MKVLVACERSGTVRDAFIRAGHDAISCDREPTEIPGPHYQGDVFDLIDYPFDLLIAHPPCTHLSVSGAAHFKAKRLDGRQHVAVAFFMQIERRSAHIPRVAIENPVCIMSSLWRKPDQIIQPNQFGHDASKATCLWLKRLPLLKSTCQIAGRIVEGGVMRWSNQTDSGQNRLPPSKDRAVIRSTTYPGIANAMADQWGQFNQQLSLNVAA